MKKYTRGFTLIELLVVIAIIGILSSVVLVSLNSARSKGNAAALQANLTGIRSQVEIVADGGSYANVCSNPTISAAVTAARNAGAGAGGCSADADEWVAYANYKDATTVYFCVDHKGIAATTTKSTYTTDGDRDCD